MRSPGSAGSLSIRTAVALGALQGPAELLPISSSAHLSAAAWLTGSRYGALEGELRKAFEVAVHAATALALGVALRDELRELAATRRLGFLAAASAPAALAGLAFERPIERRLGTPGSVAAGLLIGAAALAASDRASGRRTRGEAGVVDGLWLGGAQACALVPGVSRSGATLAVARARGFARADAARLSRDVAWPVLAGAAGLKALRLARGGVPGELRAPLVAGAAAALASTVASRGLLAAAEGPLTRFAVYRVALAAALVRADVGEKART